MKVRLWMVLLFLVLLGTTVWALERHARSEAEERAKAAEEAAEAAHRAVDSLIAIEDSIKEAYRIDTVAYNRWRTQWDTVFADTGSTVEVIKYVANETIKACEAAKLTCEARVAVATERADSAGREASHWQEAAKQWEKIAKGPFLRPALELTTTLDWQPQAAFDLTLGRGTLKALGRIEVGEGDESCDFVPSTESYTCSSSLTTTGRLGVRWTP